MPILLPLARVDLGQVGRAAGAPPRAASRIGAADSRQTGQIGPVAAAPAIAAPVIAGAQVVGALRSARVDTKGAESGTGRAGRGDTVAAAKGFELE
ncbi:f-box domain protein [Neofusicoccum parvum]|uniref:F-box domain protein n=1 Tax=Neofusicoccum parvum TaxID=310453 RepID=A0ACB5SHH8_9PEZI|nr:f-box domain protein [Neofusicoccum parvum]